MFRKALFILSGNAATSVLTLVRNLLIARLISVEDYGIAATFAMAMTLVEMVSTLGMQQQIVQAKNGDDPEFQAGLQGFNLLRGIFAAATLYLAAGWIAGFLGIPEVAWAYQVLAVVPIFNALQHFDIYRLTRRMNYRPQIAATAVPALVALLVVWPMAVIWNDYRIMLVSILVQIGLMMAISHLMAERRFQLRLDRAVTLEAVKFGWPLLVNNLLLFAVFNGDRIIVGREMGMASLAILAMGFTLTLTPTLVLAKSAQNFFLPQLAAVQDNRARFDPLAIATLQAVVLMALMFLVGVIALGGPFIDLVLGDKYAALPPLMIWLGILQVVRVAKAGGAIVALAQGQTENAMVANGVRLLALPVAWVVAANGGDLLQIIWVGIIGETLGLAVSLALIWWRLHLPLTQLVVPFALAAAILVAAGLHAWTLTPETASGLPGVVPMLTITGLIALSIWTMRPLRAYVRQRDMIKLDTSL